jgi:hypothetical protein
MSDEDFLTVIKHRRSMAAAAQRRRKAGDVEYWARRAQAYDRAQERLQTFESKQRRAVRGKTT